MLGGEENTSICYLALLLRGQADFFLCLGSSRQGTGGDRDEEEQEREEVGV